jgi:S1-C subfamily serine protease
MCLPLMLFVTGCATTKTETKTTTEKPEQRYADWALELGALPVGIDFEIQQEYKLLDKRGLFVYSVEPQSAGDIAGLKQYDVILQIGDTPVYDKGSFVLAIEEAYAQSKHVPFHIRRGDKPMKLFIQLR